MRLTVDNSADNALAPEQNVRRGGTGFIEKWIEIIGGRDGHHQARHMSLIAFAIRVVSAGIAFLAQIFLARLMGQFEYGIFVFVWVIAIIAGNLSCFGFHTAIIRFLPQYAASGDFDKIRGLTLTTRLAALVVASLVALSGVVLLYFFADRIAAYYLVPLVLGALLLPMIALGDAMDGTARANSWLVQALTPTYLVRPLLIPVAMVAAVRLGYDASAQTAMIAAIVATYATTVGQLLLLGRRLRNKFQPGPRAYSVGHWAAVAMPILLIEGFYFLLTNADVIMVGLFLTPENTATYFAAAKSMALVHFVYFSVKAGMTPRFSQLIAEEKQEELAQFATTAARWTFLPSLIVGGVVLALGPLILLLFGPNFSAGYPVMFILFAGIAVKSFIGPGEALLTMAGQQKICAVIYVAVLTLNIAGNVVLIPRLGIEGAATATAAAMMVEAALLYAVIRNRLGITMHVFGARPLPEPGEG